MRREVYRIWEQAPVRGWELLFHNAPFDLSVAEQAYGVAFPPWDLVHDTQYLIYLHDPHAPDLSLKPSAERILEIPPTERDELKEWILANIAKSTKKNWGAHIWLGPLSLVERYAKQDVVLTRQLFNHLIEPKHLGPYNRERELMPLLVGATRHGIRVATKPLAQACEAARGAQAACEAAIAKHLNAPGLNPHSGAELAKALEKEGAVTQWELTPTGRKSTKKENLMRHIQDKQLLRLLMYTSALQTCIGTFMEPWLEKSAMTGRLHPNWNQVRSMEGKRKGTRTGRLSSDDPNFQNIPVPFAFELPLGLPPMPRMREFILPEEGSIWVSRDFANQEMRILAHYEEGLLHDAFCANPALDPHSMVQGIIKEVTGLSIKRKYVKNIGFGMIYGMGVPALAKQMGVDKPTAKEMINAYHQAIPGVGTLQAGTKRLGQRKKAIKTWGGRSYYAETPITRDGRRWTFEYKLLNYLIQGSAADQTKQCIIEWFKRKRPCDVFTATVHDEINLSIPIDEAREGAAILREVMAMDLFDVPMRSSLEIGNSWGDLIEVKEA